jgi:hypothetical protein
MRGSLPRIANQETENPILVSEFLKIRTLRALVQTGTKVPAVFAAVAPWLNLREGPMGV